MEEYILGLDIPVHDFIFYQQFKGICQLNENDE